MTPDLTLRLTVRTAPQGPFFVWRLIACTATVAKQESRKPSPSYRLGLHCTIEPTNNIALKMQPELMHNSKHADAKVPEQNLPTRTCPKTISATSVVNRHKVPVTRFPVDLADLQRLKPRQGRHPTCCFPPRIHYIQHKDVQRKHVSASAVCTGLEQMWVVFSGVSTQGLKISRKLRAPRSTKPCPRRRPKHY